MDKNFLIRLSNNFSSLLEASSHIYSKKNSDIFDAHPELLNSCQKALEELDKHIDRSANPIKPLEIDENGFAVITLLYDPDQVQRYLIANLDKQEFIDLEVAGKRLGELSSTCLFALINPCNVPGAVGELKVGHPLIGSWSGNSISAIGSFSDRYETAKTQWKDITISILRVALQDEDIGEEYEMYYLHNMALSYKELQKMGLPEE